MGLQEVFATAVNNDPYAGVGQKIKNSYNTAGGYIGKDSLATKVGDFIGYHPFRSSQTKLAASDQQPQQQPPQDQSQTQPQDQGQGNPDPLKNLKTLANYSSTRTGGLSASEKAALEDQKRKENFIKNTKTAYSKFDDVLGSKSGFVQSEQDRLLKGVDDLRSSFAASNDQFMNGGLAEVGQKRQDTQETQRKSLSDLAENTRKQFMAGNVILGTKGASDSSAAGMYSKALTEGANMSRQDLLGQAKKQYEEIDGAEKRIHQTHDTEMQNMEDWLKTNVAQIKQDFGEQRKSILDIMDNAPDWKRADLESLDQNNLNKAYAMLNNIEAQAKSWRAMLGTWRDTNVQKINSMKQSLIDSGRFTEEDLKLKPVDDTLKYDPEMDTEDYYNPQIKGKKKVIKDFLDNPLIDNLDENA